MSPYLYHESMYIPEYCSLAWHDSMTQDEKNAIERLQIVALKIILGVDCPRKPDGHYDYPEALRLCKLKSLFDRMEAQTLAFGKKSIKHSGLKLNYLNKPLILMYIP